MNNKLNIELCIVSKNEKLFSVPEAEYTETSFDEEEVYDTYISVQNYVNSMKENDTDKTKQEIVDDVLILGMNTLDNMEAIEDTSFISFVAYFKNTEDIFSVTKTQDYISDTDTIKDMQMLELSILVEPVNQTTVRIRDSFFYLWTYIKDRLKLQCLQK